MPDQPLEHDISLDQRATAGQRTRTSVELLARTPLSSRVHLLRFAAQSPLRWAAGQHLVVVRGQEQELFLPYSFASAYDPQKPGEFELAVAFRAGADVIDELPSGATLEVTGPSGRFTWQSQPGSSALLVGVGTGIAPLRALIQEQLARDPQTRLVLLAGHRTLEDTLFASDFAALARAHPSFRFIPTLTLAEPSWLGSRGRVQAQLIQAANSLGPLDAYVCGRADMVNEVLATLQAHGIPPERMHSEGF